MRKIIFLMLGFSIALLGLFSIPANAQKAQQAEYFSQTGHWVKGEFLDKWTAAQNGILLYGFPLTEEFQSGGLRIQYFQRARFEFHPENPLTRQVVVADLGVQMWVLAQKSFAESAQPPLNSPACLNFSGQALRVCYAFKDFYNANNGPEQFGSPLSNIGVVDGRLVQYFERARFEWHPELASGQRVTLTNIGQIYFDLNEDRRWAMPELAAPSDANVDSAVNLIPVKSLQVYVFPVHATMEPSGSQSIYVIVKDQMLRAVAGASVDILVTLPSGKTVSTVVQTDARGIAKAVFEISNESAGLAQVIARVSLPEIVQQSGRSSYRIW